MRNKRPLRRLRDLLALVVLIGVASPLVVEVVSIPEAHARKKKSSNKKQSKKASPKPAEKAAASKAGEGEQATPAEDTLRTSGPAAMQMPFSEKEFDNTARADKKRDEAIEEIRTLIPKVKGEQKGELIFRLAELYWAKSRYIYFQEFKQFDEAMQAYVDGGHQGKEPRLEDFTGKSEAYKKQALQNYSIVLEKYPEYPRLDEVLYIMAYNEYQAGKKNEAIKNYSKLIRQYPQSEYVADSYLALGEHYFAENDLAKATKAYEKAFEEGKKQNRPGTYRYAEYKLGWCDYNRQEYDKALAKFKNVIKESERATKDGDAVRLKEEALNDTVLTFAQLNQVEPAYKYFRQHSDNDKAFRLTTKLAGIYGNQGKHQLEVEAYRFLINTDPDNVAAPDFQSAIVNAYSKLGEHDAVRKEVRRLVELYRPGSPWWRKNESNQSAVERARAIAESRMREMVTEYHRFAQKFKKVDDYTLARDLYADYLQAFPDSEHAYRLSFFYAEILWDLDEWEKAAGAYDTVVTLDPKGEYTRNAAWNAILAWEKIVKGEKPRSFKKGDTIQESKSGARRDGKVQDVRSIEKIEKGREYKARPIPDAEVKLAAACDRYVSVVPEEAAKKDPKLMEELIVVKFKAGYIYQSYYHFDEAAKRLGELIDRWPSSDYARRGADLILDSYAAREEWDNLEHWSRTFAKNKPLMKDPKFAQAVATFMEGASFKSIELFNENAKKLEKKDEAKAREMYAQAAERFMAFVKEFPKSEFAPIALYNSQLIYKKAVQLDLAIAAANRLLNEYKKEIGEGELLKAKVEEQTLLNLASYNEQVANYRVAADHYLAFVDKFKDHPDAPNALYNAGIFYLGLGDSTSAVKSFARYVKDFEKRKDVKDIPAVYLQMASVYENDEDWKRAAALYGEFEKLHGKDASATQLMTARYKHAFTLEKAGRGDEMREVCRGILAGFSKLKDDVKKQDITQLAGGYCAFQVLEPEWQEYKRIQIVTKGGGNPRAVMAQVKTALDLKLKKRDEIAKKYIDILNYGNGEWGVAGLYRASEALLDYVDTLRNAPDPPPLANNPEALDLFRAELDNIAFPVEDEAIKALDKALETAFRLGIYSDYTIAIEEKLKLFRPSAFGEVREMPFFPSAGTPTVTRTAQR